MSRIPNVLQCDVFWHVPVSSGRAGKADKIKVGTLVRDLDHIYFAYDPGWLPRGIEISPGFLPLEFGVTPISLTDLRSHAYVVDPGVRKEFRGLPGPFYDSLPDKWGMSLLANFTGREPDELAALDILCHRGNRCMGAFSYEPAGPYESGSGAVTGNELDLYCRHAAGLASGKDPEPLEESILNALEDSGGSAGGMRPKMLLALRTEDLEAGESSAVPAMRRLAGYDHRDMPAGFEPWLLKFDTEPDRCRGLIEKACADMARAAGVIMPESILIHTVSPGGVRRSHFAVRRFDRQLSGGEWHRVHMHTSAGLLQRDYNALDLDYTDLLELTRVLTNDPEQVRQVYTRAVFNVLAGNSDDHAKNHAFLQDAAGRWSVSPAYDLTPSSLRLRPGVRSTSVLGEKSERVPLSTLLALADEHELDEPMPIIRQVADAVSRWRDFAKEVGLPGSISERFERRMKDLKPDTSG